MISSHIPNVPAPKNEPINDYIPGSPETLSLQAEWDRMAAKSYEIPCVINGEKVTTRNYENVVMPHNHSHILGLSLIHI